MTMSPGTHCPTCGQSKFAEAQPVTRDPSTAVTFADLASATAAAAHPWPTPWWASLLEEVWPIIEPRLTELLGRLTAKL